MVSRAERGNIHLPLRVRDLGQPSVTVCPSVSRAGAAAGPLRGLRAAVVVSKEEARDRARARGTTSCRCSSVAFSARAESTRGGDYARTCSRSGQLDIKAVEKVAHIVGEWNKAKIIDKPVP